MTHTDNVLTLLRLELADALRSRWLLFTCLVYAAVLGAFVWLGLRESSVLGFTGLSRVVLNLSNAVVVIIPLVVLVATCQAIVRARTSGLLELLLVQPCRRDAWFIGLVGARLLVLLGPLVLLVLGMLAIGLARGEGAVLVAASARTLLVGGALVWAFLGLGLLVSATARTPERAIVHALLVWAAASALHDFALIGLLLRVRLPPASVFALAALNPVEAARIGILSGVDPELSILGPVGFWLANTLGPRVSLLIGTTWPLALGTTALWLAARKLRSSDLVG
jgi:ABC-2 type transport system permease protein